MYILYFMENGMEQKLARELLNVIMRFNENDKKARNFGTDTPLHISEIHMIESIGSSEGLSVSEIARRKNITKGAVSQTLMRLEEKKFVVKSSDPKNKSRAAVFLTEKGRTAFREHRRYHEKFAELVAQAACGKSGEEINLISGFLARLENLL